MEKLKVGVIGLGMGRAHIRGYQSHPAVEVVAVADPDQGRLKDVGDEFNIPRRYAAAEEMFQAEKLDIVSVATPNVFHKPLTMAAFKAGCHVLCEKPMAMNAGEAYEMLDASRKAGKRLMVNFNYRFTEQSMALKRQVETGAIGEVYFARTIWHRRRGTPRMGSWFGQKEMSGGGPLIDLGVHRLDLALWLMGYPQPVWVMGSAYNAIAAGMAKAVNAKYNVEDLAVGMIKFANGATLEVEASWAANIKESELMETRLFGTQGGLVQRNLNEAYQFEAELNVEQNGSHFDMKLHPPMLPVPASAYHFADSILNGVPHIATGEEGLLVMDLLDAIYRSAAEGQPVQVPQRNR